MSGKNALDLSCERVSRPLARRSLDSLDRSTIVRAGYNASTVSASFWSFFHKELTFASRVVATMSSGLPYGLQVWLQPAARARLCQAPACDAVAEG
jgi:hypothetical protein